MSDARNQPAALEGSERLPESFVAKRVPGKGLSVARKGMKAVMVQEGSLPAIAEAMRSFFPQGPKTLDPGMSLTIVDEFTGRKAAVPASALADVAALLGTLVRAKAASPAPAPATAKEESQKPAEAEKRESQKPAEGQKEDGQKAIEAAPAGKAASKSKSGERKAARRKPDEANIAEDKKAEAEAAEANIAEDQKAEAAEAGANDEGKPSAPKRQRTPRVAPELAGAEPPAWYRDLKDRYEIDGGQFGTAEMLKARLEVDRANPKDVKGKAKSKDSPAMWGFEVLSGGRHVAWVVAEDERSFVITGVPDYKPSTHRVIDGVAARLSITVLPRVLSKAA